MVNRVIKKQKKEENEIEFQNVGDLAEIKLDWMLTFEDQINKINSQYTSFKTRRVNNEGISNIRFSLLYTSINAA